jgi:hypothetical protein
METGVRPASQECQIPPAMMGHRELTPVLWVADSHMHVTAAAAPMRSLLALLWLCCLQAPLRFELPFLLTWGFSRTRKAFFILT